jgi:hypothetical protein
VKKEVDTKFDSLIKRWAKESLLDVNISKISHCFFCKYLGIKETCEAFPNGIPEEILNNQFIHTKHYEGDNGILFEPKEEKYRNVEFKPLR